MSSDIRNIRGMYGGINNATGPSLKTTPAMKAKRGQSVMDSSK